MPKGGEAYKAPDAKGVPAINNIGASRTVQDIPELSIESKKSTFRETAGHKTSMMPKGG